MLLFRNRLRPALDRNNAFYGANQRRVYAGARTLLAVNMLSHVVCSDEGVETNKVTGGAKSVII